MLNNLQISAVHSQVTEKEKSYARKKIGALEKFIPKSSRPSTSVEIKLKQIKSKDKNDHECEVIMKLPKNTITSHRASTTFMVAIDEVEENLKKQLKSYKDKRTISRLTRHSVARIAKKLGTKRAQPVEE